MQVQVVQPTRLRRARELARKFLRSPFALVAGIAIGYVVLILLYVQADRNATELERRTQVNRAALRRPVLELGQLETQLREAEATIESLESRRVTTIPEEDLVRQTLAAAQDAGITVSNAGTRAQTIVEKEGGRVRATPFFLRATGEIPQIEQFLAAMERGRVETLELQSALVTRETNIHVLTLSAVIYSHLPLTAEQAGAQGQSTPTAAAGKGLGGAP